MSQNENIKKSDQAGGTCVAFLTRTELLTKDIFLLLKKVTKTLPSLGQVQFFHFYHQDPR